MWQGTLNATGFASRWHGPDGSCTGKWLVPVELGDPDGVWDRIAVAAATGRVPAAKLSAPRLDAILGHHLACVYCRSCERGEMEALLRTLRELGASGRLDFKSDRATAENSDAILATSLDFEGPEARPY